MPADQPLDLGDKMLFYHLSFDKVRDAKLRKQLRRIPTNFKIDKKHAALIDKAMPRIVNPEDATLQAIRFVLLNPDPGSPSLRKFKPELFGD